MKMKLFNRMLMLLLTSMFIMLLTATDDSYTYWSNLDLLKQENTAISIGSWNTGPDGISKFNPTTAYYPNDLVWYNGNLWRYKGNYTLGSEPSNENGWIINNDLSWYSTIIYRTGDLVYFNGNIYTSSYEHINQNPETTGMSGPWENVLVDTISWVPGQASELNDIVYHNGAIWIFRNYYTTTEPGTTNQWSLLGDINFSLDYVYENGDIVSYNGNYYTTTNGGWATGTTPGTNAAWTMINVPMYNNKLANGTTYTLYNGLLYQALVTINGSNRGRVPGTPNSKGIWNAINTQQWQQYNTYTNSDLVMYQGDVYQLVNSVNSSDIPGTTQNSWNGMATLDYLASNIYVDNDYVIYNSNIYQVVNAVNANQYVPGSYADAWNQLNGYDWYWFNTYQPGDVVYYMNAVYVALQTTTNHQPDLLSSNIYWSLYEN